MSTTSRAIRLPKLEERAEFINEFSERIVEALPLENLTLELKADRESMQTTISNLPFSNRHKGVHVPHSSIYVKDRSRDNIEVGIHYLREASAHDDFAEKGRIISSLVSPIHRAAYAIGLQAAISTFSNAPALEIYGEVNANNLLDLKPKLEDVLKLLTASSNLMYLTFKTR